MEPRSDQFESAKSHLFDTSGWGSFCDVTLTLKQARQSEGKWIRIADYPCRQAFRHFMNLLNRAVYGARFVGIANSFGFCPYLKKANSAPALCIFGSVKHPADGISIVLWNCPGTSTPFASRN
jgi:hypothetical protein